MSNNFYIFLDSSDKVNGTVSDFSVNFSSFNFQPGTECSVSLDQFTMYNLQYPVNATTNSIVFQENSVAVSATATLTIGNYSGNQIATEIASKMTTASLNAYTYTGAYNSNTGKLTITADAAHTFKLITINAIYGYASGTAFANSAIGSYPLNMSGVNYIDVLLQGLSSNNMSSSKNSSSIIKRIPVDCIWGELISFNSQESDDSILVDHSSLENIQVRIINPDGSFYENQNQECSIVLKCSLIY